jgi:hypothetical protein
MAIQIVYWPHRNDRKITEKKYVTIVKVVYSSDLTNTFGFEKILIASSNSIIFFSISSFVRRSVNESLRIGK